ncbi:MAG: hypothetical protein ACOVNO_04900 [Sediminibacterium sp.]
MEKSCRRRLMMKVCLLRQQKVKELTRKTYLHHQYKLVPQKPDYSTINQTDYWEDVTKAGFPFLHCTDLG